MNKIPFQTREDVAETLLVPLYCRAVETRRPDALMRDANAVALVEQIDYDFSRIKLQAHDWVAIILRVRQVDSMARDFLVRHPDAVIMHIGCGLDTRFERLDNGLLEWYDLDLPGVIDLRRQLVPAKERCHTIAASVFDDAWIESVTVYGSRPFLFIAEGVLPYFEEARVKALLLTLQRCFPAAGIIFDFMTPFALRTNNLQLTFSHLKARLHFALKHPADIEAWSPGIRLLQTWYYFDQPEPRMRMHWMRHIPFLARSTGILVCSLG
jgi:O-methyltransferase involved in polyketide biosynthesis